MRPWRISVKPDDRTALRELTMIPGVGKKIAADLVALGIRSVDDLKGQDAQQLFEALCAQTGAKVDRCMLYVFRCAVYYASTEHPDPALLKWWNWKDDRQSGRKSASRR
jgi:hypothetical protein